MRKQPLVRGVPIAILAAILAGAVGMGRVDAQPNAPAEVQAAAKAAFAEADADGSGELSAGEFAALHEIMRATMDAARFTRLDTDGSGGLTEAELSVERPGRDHGPEWPGN